MLYIYSCDCIETNVKINFNFYVHTGTYENWKTTLRHMRQKPAGGKTDAVYAVANL
jgi:hypothetical protein